MESSDVKKVLVVGAGVMGHSIAQVFAQAGITVNLVDLDETILDRAMGLARANLDTLAEFDRVSAQDIPAILDRIRPSTDLKQAVEDVQFAMETVSEKSDIKREVFSQLDRYCPEGVVIASNTSSLDVFSIAEMTRPERFAVAHWFAPPHIIPLVEVVPGPKTSPGVIHATASLMERVGKRPVVMKAFVQSFIVNRIQNAVIRTVWEMLEKGWAEPEEIDVAVKTSLGIRLPIVGVVQTTDFTGLDLVHDVMKAQGDVIPLVAEKVAQGHLGAKTGKGVYDYQGRSEAEILRDRDRRYLKLLDHLEKIKAFEPV